MRVAFKSWLVGSLSACFLLACGGPEPLLSVESPSVVTVVPGSSTTLTVNMERNETAKGSFSFVATGLPSGVSATFAPAEAGEDTTQLSLTLDATRDAARGPALVTLTATGTGKEPLVATTTLALEVRGITVNGRVSGGFPGAVSRIRVGASLTTPDGEGRFTVDDVALPYDLTVASSIGGFLNIVESYPGLTTTEPEVRAAALFGPGGGVFGNAQVTLSAAVPADQIVKVCATGVGGEIGSECSDIAAGGSTTTLNLAWTGAPTQQVQIQAYGYAKNAAGALAQLHSAGQSPVFTVEGGASPAVTVTMGAAPTTTQVTTTFEVPDWAAESGVMTLAPVGGRFVTLAEPDMSGAATTAFPGAPSVAVVNGPDGVGIAWRPAAADSSVPLAFPSLPRLLSAPVVSQSSDVVLSAPAAGELSMVVAQFSPNGLVIVHTMSDRATIPDLSDFFPMDASPVGQIMARMRASPYTSMDDAVRGESLLERFFMLSSDAFIPDHTSAGGITVISNAT